MTNTTNTIPNATGNCCHPNCPHCRPAVCPTCHRPYDVYWGQNPNVVFTPGYMAPAMPLENVGGIVNDPPPATTTTDTANVG